MDIRQGARVRHRKDRGLGIGLVELVKSSAGQPKVLVGWPTKPDPSYHLPEELDEILSLADILAKGDVGPETLIPFQLLVLGRWFECRHGLTGELSNQPFQMLPHQVIVANRVVNSAADNRRWLIADDVGLGKTIEAGMIMEVLRKRTLGRFRCLIVTPAGLMEQWIEEMETRFSRRFSRFLAGQRQDIEDRDLLVGSIDTLKQKKHEEIFETASPWDLVIFDEAHHLATEPSVQKYKLAKFLRDKGLARNLLFLTATPHSGESGHFLNMLRLLREDLFRSEDDLTRGDGRLNQVMIRNRKSDVTDTRGERIFKGIEPAQILTCQPTPDEVEFYEELLQYVRDGYRTVDRLERQRKGSGLAVGFLMATFRKLASSSRAAIRSALENRLAALKGDGAESRDGDEEADARFEGESEERRSARVALDAPAGRGKKQRAQSPIKDELTHVERLLAKLDNLETDDSKLLFFVARMKELPADLKILVFTEYRGTQSALLEGLQRQFGEEALTFIHGSMKLDERRKRVNDFNENIPNPRFMVSTEAGGEGLNMQKSCHVVVNYDLPWNPIRLQQRIGRVYRYGQAKRVQVYNVRLDSDSDAFADVKIDEYLRRKIGELTRALAQVQEGQPEDIEAEVVGQVAQQLPFDKLYEMSVRQGEARARAEIDRSTKQVEEIMKDPQGFLNMFKNLKRFDITAYEKAAARVTSEQLSFFLQQYLARQGEPVRKDRDGLWSFVIPKPLIEIAKQIVTEDVNEARRALKEGKVEKATIDKEVAGRTLGARLLRFGDPVFDSAVRHVQQSDFSGGVTSLSIPANALGWPVGQKGLCALFDLKLLRSGGSTTAVQIVRDEIVAIGVPRGGEPLRVDRFLDLVHAANDGPLDVDADWVRRAYKPSREAAEQELMRLRGEIESELGTEAGLIPQVDDLAAAWIEAI